jgi:hypothetical protein
MFYLTEFVKSLGESLMRGIIFFFLTCLLAFSLTHRSWVEKVVAKISPEKLVNPYFVAVLDGSVNTDKFKQILAKLPGVLTIDEKENERGVSKVNSLIAELGSEYKLSNSILDFRSVRIILNPTLSTDSFEFIRNQAVKLVGKDHVTATEIKYPEVTQVMKSHPFYLFLNKAGDWGIILIFSILWITSYWLCYDIFRSRAYILEKYQRKKFVAAKSLAMGLGSVFLLFTVLAIWNGTLKFVDLALLFMIFSTFWTFSMQEWKWKPTL